MRILMFMPGLSGSSLGWRVHHDFAEAVRARGHGFEIVTTADDDAEIPPDLPGMFRTLRTTSRWRAVGRSLAPWLRTPSLFPAAAALAKHLRLNGHEIDLLHVEVAYPHGTAALLGARWGGWHGPIAITPMGEDVLVVRDAHYGFRRHLAPRMLVRHALRRAAAVRSISAIVLDVVRPWTRRAAIAVVPLNVTHETLSASAEDDTTRLSRRATARSELAAELGIGERPVVVAMGRLHPFKGIPVLVEALTQLRSDAHLVIAGPSLAGKAFGDHAQDVLRLASELGASGRVHWIGAVAPPRALELLRAADVLVVPSLLESLNKVCIEAAAVGTPFVVTSSTGIAEWTPASGVGLVVPPRDPATLAATLDRVLDGRFRGNAATQREFVARFAPRRIADQVLDLYATIPHPRR